MAQIRSLLILLIVALAAPALAADVVYPPGSRIGLVPPPGLVPSAAFQGYADPVNNVAIVVGALPVEAYAAIEKSATAEVMKKQGVTLEKRETLPLANGKAVLVIGRQQIENVSVRKWLMVAAMPELTALVSVQMPEAAKSVYPDAVIRTALASLAVRPTVPVEEQLSLLPFRVGELAGFQVNAVLPGRAVILSDSTSGAQSPSAEPHMVVAVASGGPAQAGDRDAFARDVFATIPNMQDIRITTSESLRIGGMQGHQILANAKDPSTGADVTIVQWLRFGGGAYLHYVGVARVDDWIKAYARFRSVRDGIDVR
jgi:hypothetical protein